LSFSLSFLEAPSSTNIWMAFARIITGMEPRRRPKGQWGSSSLLKFQAAARIYHASIYNNNLIIYIIHSYYIYNYIYIYTYDVSLDEIAFAKSHLKRHPRDSEVHKPIWKTSWVWLKIAFFSMVKKKLFFAIFMRKTLFFYFWIWRYSTLCSDKPTCIHPFWSFYNLVDSLRLSHLNHALWLFSYGKSSVSIGQSVNHHINHL
jgi:hypothetical protein